MDYTEGRVLKGKCPKWEGPVLTGSYGGACPKGEMS